MQRLHLDALTVESFTTSEPAYLGDGGDPIALQPIGGVTDGIECGKTLNTCPPQCNTYRVTNCV